MELWTALALGFFGSFHCVGMCGPIAMSIPRSSNSFSALSFNSTVYNTGRILTYSVFGLIFGFLGAHLTISGFQGTLSIVLGAAIILGVVFSKWFKKNRPAFLNKLVSGITSAYGKLIRKQSLPALFGMGVLNGLLPCAFVYSGLAAAILTETPLHSMSYMALFGLGTFPAMFLMYLAPSVLSLDLRNSIKKLVPYLAFFLGVFLILRGIALQNLQLSEMLTKSMESFCVFPGTKM